MASEAMEVEHAPQEFLDSGSDDDVMSLSEASEVLGIGQQSLYRKLKTSAKIRGVEVRAYKDLSGRWVVVREDIVRVNQRKYIRVWPSSV